jgi:hypothetical protein
MRAGRLPSRPARTHRADTRHASSPLHVDGAVRNEFPSYAIAIRGSGMGTGLKPFHAA